MIELTDHERAALEMAAPHDLYLYSRYMFAEMRGYKWRQNWHHEAICEKLEQVFNGEIKRLIINIPPRYSKTELAVVNFTSWALGKAPDAEFIHVSYSATLAANNSSKLRSVIQHEAYQRIFKTRLESENKQHLVTTDQGAFFTTGTGGTLTGFGAGKARAEFGGCIIIDDPMKADEARSEVQRENVIDWFQNTLESRTNNRDTPIIVIMQRLHEDDLAGWLLDGGNGEEWEHLCLPAIQDDNTALWPDKHTIAELRVMEQAKPYVFAGQYQQQPAPPSGGVIKPDMIQVVDAIPAGVVKWVRGWDLASSKDEGDFTAGPKLGQLADGRYIIADLVHGQFSVDERDAAIKNTADSDGKKVKISLPQDPGQAGKTQKLYMARNLAGYSLVITPESGDKVTRAEPFAAQINVGNVMMLKASWNDALKNEMRMFPNGRHDDIVDGCSRAFAEFVPPVRKTKQRSLRI